ncbi:MAG: hypothetical protein J0626_06040, partial [Rhodospirillaceae bacterium]|nr:hypothetical protein [Rhodospirillaceae bacterium]
MIKQGLIFDPTAHAERQLIDWYYAELARGVDLPAPQDITIVTSLDPCCMCAGAILAAGFNVLVAAPDHSAGVNYDSSAHFEALPAPLRATAAASFSYPAVLGASSYRRTASGAASRSRHRAWPETAVSRCADLSLHATATRCRTGAVFAASHVARSRAGRCRRCGGFAGPLWQLAAVYERPPEPVGNPHCLHGNHTCLCAAAFQTDGGGDAGTPGRSAPLSRSSEGGHFRVCAGAGCECPEFHESGCLRLDHGRATAGLQSGTIPVCATTSGGRCIDGTVRSHAAAVSRHHTDCSRAGRRSGAGERTEDQRRIASADAPDVAFRVTAGKAPSTVFFIFDIEQDLGLGLARPVIDYIGIIDYQIGT